MSLFEKNEEKGPGPAYINEKPLTCWFCGNQRFWKRESQLHTKLMTFFELEWMNKTASCYVCEHCGYIHWFLPPEEK